MPTFLRWLLAPVAAVLTWYAVILLGLLGLGLLDRLCPPEEMISGACMAPWHHPASQVLIALCSALAAFGIVVIAAATAPAHCWSVAVVAFVGGAAFATWVAWSGAVWGPYAAAAVGGVLGLRSVRRRWQRTVRE